MEEVKKKKSNTSKKKTTKVNATKKTSTVKKKSSAPKGTTKKSVKKTPVKKVVKKTPVKNTVQKETEVVKSVELIEDEIFIPEVEIKEELIKIKKEELTIQEKVENYKLIKILLYIILLLIVAGSAYVLIADAYQKERVNEYESDASVRDEFDEENYAVNYDNLEEVEYSDLTSTLDKEKNTILLISSTDCPFCARIKPELNEVAKELDITIYYLESDLLSDEDKKELGDRFELESVPTLLYTEGQLRRGITVGYKTKDEILEWIEEEK